MNEELWRDSDRGLTKLKGDLPSQFTGPGDSPGFLLWQVANAWQRRQREALEEIGLTHVQFVLLAGIDWLGKATDPITQATLARSARVDEMMASQVLRVLEKRGAIERSPHPSDSRAKCMKLTESGKVLLARAYPLVEKTDEAFFGVHGIVMPDLLHMLRTIALQSRRYDDVKATQDVDGIWPSEDEITISDEHSESTADHGQIRSGG